MCGSRLFAILIPSFDFRIDGFSLSSRLPRNSPLSLPSSVHCKWQSSAEDLTEKQSGSKRCQFQDCSKLSYGLEREGACRVGSTCRKCGSAENTWLDEETHEVKEIRAALKFTMLATASVLS